MTPPPARVVIDARTVVPRASGIGNYVEALIRHMVPVADGFTFTILRHPRADGAIVEHERAREVVVPGETKSLRTVLMRAGRSFRDESLYHSPADIVPLGIDCPFVVTLHDLMWIESPRLASGFWPSRLALGAFYGANIAHSVRGARRVIAISNATADAIRRVFPGHAGKVSVIHHGLDRARYATSLVLPRASLDRYLARGLRYSLIVGQGSPYKNHPAMVRAFVEAMGDRDDHKLVLVRRFSRVDREMLELLGRPEVASKVVVLPFVPAEDLLALMGHARILLFVSHVEGFGLPPLEAFALGTPVLGSTAPAVVEVTGDAALHAVATDHRDMVDKIRRLEDDEALRTELVRRGAERVKAFSWDRCARATFDLYRAAIDDHGWKRRGNFDKARGA
jgi:glycosyltransferase involved in cell wall biosynthesis